MIKQTKLIIQIPCYNEEKALSKTLENLPRELPGIHLIEWLVIDDGSTDKTVEIARSNGVDHIIKLHSNRGLARAFMAGIDASLKLGADIIVNTDADNQYPGDMIRELITPILEEKSEIVIGNRQTDQISEFSLIKKLLQKLGSWVVRQASNTKVPDTVSGFRAFSREAALRMFIISDFTYTIESIIQAGVHRTKITSVPIRTNAAVRKSRLFRSVGNYLAHSASTILRVYTMYKPLKVFLYLALFFFIPAVVLSFRFLYSYIQEPEISRHIQSLIFVAILSIASIQFAVFALIADLIAANRKLIEDLMVRIKRSEFKSVENAIKNKEPMISPNNKGSINNSTEERKNN